MKAYLDPAVLVAASVSGHPHHRQDAVLTRTPFTPPVYPLEAWNLLSADILPHFEIISTTPKLLRDTIESCANHGWVGGRIYDSLHLCCARSAACERIHTFSVRHFRQLAPDLADRIGAPSGFP